MPSSSSASLFSRASRVIPGGVNSPVRAFRAVGGEPVFMVRGHGARLTTADGAELLDFCGSWGPLILGHAHPEVVEAVARAAADGMSFGACTPGEVELAETLCRLAPSLEMVRLVSSGTEAVMTALRLARGFTSRAKILKFDGGYHGHSDSLLVAAGSGLLTHGIADSAGVTPGTAADTLVASYNDLESVRALLDANRGSVAAILVEPVAGNMGLVPPALGFLQGLRVLADAAGALLIFDEVITGFRFGPTTYGNLCGVTPDLTTLGKIIGGGLPLAAVGGRAEIMQRLAPLGPVYQAGTLSGNPVAVAAGLTTLRILERDNPYPELARLGKLLADGLTAAAAAHGRKLHCARLGGVFTPFFRAGPVRNLRDAKTSDTAAYAAFFQNMLARNIYLPPAQFEAAFLSAAHTEADVAAYLAAAAFAMSAS